MITVKFCPTSEQSVVSKISFLPVPSSDRKEEFKEMITGVFVSRVVSPVASICIVSILKVI